MSPVLVATALMFSSIVIALVATKPLAARRLRVAAADPPPDAPRLAGEELRQRILDLGGEDSPFNVRESDGELMVTWQLVGIPWATLLFRQKLRRTGAVDLRISGDGRALARIRQGRVAWETAAATWMPRAVVAWSRPLFPPLPRPYTGAAPATVRNETTRTSELLLETVRHHVLAAGHRFEPVLEFPP